MKKLYLIAGLLACFFPVGIPASTIRIGPIPLYVPNPEGTKGTSAEAAAANPARGYITLDRSTNELVIAYPAILEDPDRKASQEVMRTWRVTLGIGIEPTLKVNVRNDSETKNFIYRYVLANGPGAKQYICSFLLHLPSLEGIQPTGGSSGWGVDTWELSKEYEPRYLDSVSGVSEGICVYPLEYREWLRKNLIRRKVEWFVRSDEGPLLPGGTPREFEITSRNRPGLVVSYMRAPSDTYSPYQPLPPEVGLLMNTFNFAENNSISIPTIAPKFSPNITTNDMAQDFLAQIQNLLDTMELDAGSSLLKELKPVLQAFGAGQDRSAVELFGGISQKPASELERQLLLAVKIGFDINNNTK